MLSTTLPPSPFCSPSSTPFPLYLLHSLSPLLSPFVLGTKREEEEEEVIRGGGRVGSAKGGATKK